MNDSKIHEKSDITRELAKFRKQQKLLQNRGGSNEKKIPVTSKYCIIFPFDKNKLRYLRDTYQKVWIKDVCTPELITQVITDIESACDNFATHSYYRKIIRLSLSLSTLGFLAGVVLVILGITLATSNSSEVIHASGLHMYSIIGTIMISLSLILIYLVLINVGNSTTQLNMKYLAKYDKVLSSYRKQFSEMQMRWRIGVDRLWLEVWLDYNQSLQSEANEVSETLSDEYPPSNDSDSKGSLSGEDVSEENSEEEPEEEKWERTQSGRPPSRFTQRRSENKEKREKPKGSSKFEIAAARTFFVKPGSGQPKEKKEE